MSYFYLNNIKAASISLVVGLVLPSVSRATDIVLGGWDLFETQAGTSFMGIPFQGVPLGTFDFGSSPIGVGAADTIVQRLDTATGPSDTVPIELVAMQLRSVGPIDLGAGLGFHYITLQSLRGGPASVGSMTINFGAEGSPHGTFDSFFDVFFDIRLGGLDGPIVFSNNVGLQANGLPWSHEPPLGSFVIDGVNHRLNDDNINNDFWPGSLGRSHPGVPVAHEGPSALNVVGTAGNVPDAGATWPLILVGLGFCGLSRILRRNS